jgi:hypothetical protein
MTKELITETKEYNVTVEYEGKEYDLEVTETIEEFCNWEKAVSARFYPLDLHPSSNDLEEKIVAYVEENWDNFEEVEGGHGG